MTNDLARTVAARCILLLALTAATPSIAAEPPNPNTVLREAMAKAQQDDLEGAIADLEILQEEGHATPPTLAALGALYNAIGLFEDALDLLKPLADSDAADPAVLYNAGRAALESGQGELGERYLGRSVNLEPRSPAARLLGMRLGARGRTVLAYQLLRPWALANPTDVEARLAAAATAVQLKRVDEAEELLQGADDANPRVRILRADLALRRRDATGALEWIAPLAQDPPPEMRGDILQLTATAQLELGRAQEAVDQLRPVAQGQPKLSLILAKALYQTGDVDAALAVLAPFVEPVMATAADAIPAGPSRDLAASFTLEQGRMLLATDRADAARPVLERSSELDPHRRETWQELARARAALGDSAGSEDALARFQGLADAAQGAQIPGLQGQERLNDTTGRRISEALEWMARGDADQALTIARQEISLSPDDPRPRLLEIRLLLAEGRSDDALRSAHAVVERFPESADAFHFRAVSFLASGSVLDAEKDLRRTLELDAGHALAQSDLALIAIQRGDAGEARRLLEAVLAKDPDNALARGRLEQLEAME